MGCDGEPASADVDDLLRRVRQLAAAALLARAFPDVGGRDDFCLDVGGFLHRAGLGEPERVKFIEAVALAGGSDEPRERARKGAKVRPGRNVAGFPKLKEWIGEKRARKVADWLGYGAQEATAAPGAPPGHPMSIVIKRDGVNWICNNKGVVIFCAENAGLALETHPEWADALAFDEFNAQTLLLKPIPGTRTPHKTFRPREMADKDITAIQRWFNRNGFPDATRNTTADALLLVAAQRIISPVRDYLEGIVGTSSRGSARGSRPTAGPRPRTSSPRWGGGG